MKNTALNLGLRAGNPIANIFVVIVGALAIAASVVLGFFALIIVASIVLVLASIIGIRVWWFKRSLSKRGPPQSNPGKDSTDGVIEGEYQIIAEDREGE